MASGIRKIDIDTEMQSAYLSYAMSVIVSRALPDARDGLKPVQRRILYAMHDMGITSDAAHKKSARIVGEVLGKYHPHGDAAVYDTMARMAQEFSMRCLLVDGQGNFGSVDGDAPAAMRYTEARLARAATELLADIQKDTVDFAPNFDDTLYEPEVLPAALPNLLINGATGIAVGMATSIPPHNLGEVIDACLHQLNHWTKMDDVSVEDLMKYVKGPDFPTGGVIVKSASEEEGLAAAYGTGRGKILVQAKVHVEEMERGRSRIIVTELPYQTNKSSLIERIAELARDGRIEGLADLRDESDRQGMRIVVELTKTADPNDIINLLFKHTPMQGTFSINLLALVGGEPRTLTLKQALRVFLDHRLEVVRRRSEFDLARARERAHILEGLITALKHLDEVIRIIRGARDTDDARARLIKRFKFSDAQTTAILDMPLRRLAQLERQKIEDEYKEKKELIKFLEKLLGSPKLMREVIAGELKELKSKFGDRRRTQIVEAGASRRDSVKATDLVPDEEAWVTVTRSGLLSRAYGGKQPKFGKDDSPLAVIQASTRDLIYLITQKGRASAVSVYSIPESDDPANGSPFSSLCPLDSAARVVTAVSVPAAAREAAPRGENGGGAESNGAGVFMVIATAKGMVKKIAAPDLPLPSSKVGQVMTVAEDDAIVSARLSEGSDEVLLVSAFGQSIRFKEAEVRAMGTGASGVQGIKLSKPGDTIVAMSVVDPKGEAFLITDVGIGKRVPMKDFPTQGRYGVGTIAMAVKGKSKLVGAVIGTPDDKLVMLTTKGGARLTKFDEAPKRGRPARGGTVLKLKPGDAVEGLVPFAPRLVIAAPEPVGKKAEVRGRKSAAAKKDKAAKPAKKAPAPKAKAKTKKK
ncbi:MAG TPA: DNA gyrase subunit A [Anaerolineales bacterium]|nr:DNA gyrase subunit A [Anaerolineales bacterium]